MSFPAGAAFPPPADAARAADAERRLLRLEDEVGPSPKHRIRLLFLATDCNASDASAGARERAAAGGALGARGARARGGALAPGARPLRAGPAGELSHTKKAVIESTTEAIFIF
ncbi:uncharacterized protein LOC114351637 [Ostrinia furnacalis]|uniref:uncharacterized protein LOC114351637 n=1 Tax=Ostrinia furnacalis TaxID=93504 RepID=UPI00103B6B47|nr:uncharacterized protein LOC114351637 [Ostrinia furnacalis]